MAVPLTIAGTPWYIPPAMLELHKIPTNATLLRRWSAADSSVWSMDKWFQVYNSVMGYDLFTWLKENQKEIWLSYVFRPKSADVEYQAFSVLSPEEKTAYHLRFAGYAG